MGIPKTVFTAKKDESSDGITDAAQSWRIQGRFGSAIIPRDARPVLEFVCGVRDRLSHSSDVKQEQPKRNARYQPHEIRNESKPEACWWKRKKANMEVTVSGCLQSTVGCPDPGAAIERGTRGRLSRSSGRERQSRETGYTPKSDTVREEMCLPCLAPRLA